MTGSPPNIRTVNSAEYIKATSCLLVSFVPKIFLLFSKKRKANVARQAIIAMP
jgi:hypothetical protein